MYLDSKTFSNLNIINKMQITHKKVNKTKKVVRKGKKMSGGSRKVNRTRKVGGNRSRKVGRSRKMVGGYIPIGSGANIRNDVKRWEKEEKRNRQEVQNKVRQYMSNLTSTNKTTKEKRAAVNILKEIMIAKEKKGILYVEDIEKIEKQVSKRLLPSGTFFTHRKQNAFKKAQRQFEVDAAYKGLIPPPKPIRWRGRMLSSQSKTPKPRLYTSAAKKAKSQKGAKKFK